MTAVNPTEIPFGNWPVGGAGIVFYANPGATSTIPTANLPGMIAPSINKATWKATEVVMKAEGNNSILRQRVIKKGWELQIDYQGRLDPAFESYVTGETYGTMGSAPIDSADSHDVVNQAIPTLAIDIWANNDDGNGTVHWGAYNAALISFGDDVQELDKYDTMRTMKFAILPDADGAMRRRAWFLAPTPGDPTAQPSLKKLLT